MENLTDDHYEFIGVKLDATDSEIKQACNKLLLKYHPDYCKAVYADRITQHICEIKSVLLDPGKRKVYDETLTGNKDEKVVHHLSIDVI
jgi:DnaJ-class molecular chaperone